MALQPGVILNGRYRIEETIATGGMGAVYRATDTVLNIQVAVKENFLNSEKFSRQFRREATILAGLNHPNLPRVTDHFSLNGDNLYLVMDFIDGLDLRSLIANVNQMQESEVLRIGEVTCDALIYLHSRQPAVVHRDVKPGNIKITSSNQIVLVDFGLAKLDAQGKTTTGAQAYTPGYSPPEQYGSGTEPRSDIYALGATLYAALTGKIPQDGLERAMGTCDLTPILKHNPAVSAQTAQVIEKAMSIRLEDRFATAEEFQHALHTCRQALSNPDRTADNSHPAQSAPNEKLPAAPPPAHAKVDTRMLEPGVEVPKKRAFPWVGLALFLLAGLILAILLATRALQPQQQPTRAPTQATTATPIPAAANSSVSAKQSAATATSTATVEPSATARPGPTVTIQPSPTFAATPLGGLPGTLAFSSARSGTTQVWLTTLGSRRSEQVTNLPDGACQPDWSPDGLRIVFVSPCTGRKDSYPGSSLFIINWDGSGLIPLATLPGGDYDPAWSPDGKKIAFTSLRGGRENIYLYDLVKNSTTRVSSPVNVERRPAWSPDGSLIAYETRRNGPSQIWVMAASGQNMREFSRLSAGDSFMPSWAPLNPADSGRGLIVYSQGSQQPFLTGQEFNNPDASEFHLSEKVRGVLDARFSTDGWWLAVTLFDETGKSTIAMLLRNGSNLTPIPNTMPGDFHPAWRPAQGAQ